MTGGSRGLGRAIADALSSAGADVASRRGSSKSPSGGRGHQRNQRPENASAIAADVTGPRTSKR